MRIAIIYLGRRGAGGIISLELSKQLVANHQVIPFLSDSLENLRRWEKSDLNPITINTYKNAVGAFGSLIFVTKIRHLVKSISTRKPDVLVFPMFHPWNSFIQKELKEIPSVIFVHDPHPHPDLSGWFYEKLEQKSIKLATRCVVLSESLKSSLVKRGVPLNQLDKVALGPFSFPESVSTPKPMNHPPTLLFFGRLAPYKGLSILVKAYAVVRKDIPCQLLIAGNGNINKILGKNHGKDIRLVNRWIPETEIPDIFAEADVVVLPYTSASQSGVIPIAAVYGLPVIATRVGGLTEQIEDGINGWLVPPNDSNALAKTIREVLTNPQEAKIRGAALMNRYKNELGWEQSALQLIGSLEMAVSQRKYE